MEINTYRILLDEDKRPILVVDGSAFVETSLGLDCPARVYGFACDFLKMDQLAEEHVYVIGTDTRMQPMGISEVGHGTVDACLASMRSVMIRLLLMGASRFVLLHNHPSGDPRPSEDDIRITEVARRAGELIDIQMVDHIIVGRDCYAAIEDGGSRHDYRVYPRQAKSSKA